MTNEGRNTMKRRIAPGIWEDMNGHIHWSIAELLEMVALENTPENRRAVEKILREMLAQHAPPGAKIIHREKLETGYTIDLNGPSITCHNCGRTSFNPNDVREKYCGFCHAYHQ